MKVNKLHLDQKKKYTKISRIAIGKLFTSEKIRNKIYKNISKSREKNVE